MKTLNQLKLHFKDQNEIIFEHFSEIDSTNTYLKDKQEDSKNRRISIALADQQLAGRGRSGKNWYSPNSENLYVSFKFKLEGKLQPLSLIVGAELCKIINNLSEKKIAPNIKWPNDIILDRKKVSGILVETEIDNGGFIYTVGIGINFMLPNKVESHWGIIPQVKQLNRFAITKELSLFIQALTQNGIPINWQQDWEQASIHKRNSITLKTNNSEIIKGEYFGISNTGSLIIITNGEKKEFASGECSLEY
ncbi:MAG: hypothetical protein RI886_825 [Pseudomonadota bacterium]